MALTKPTLFLNLDAILYLRKDSMYIVCSLNRKMHLIICIYLDIETEIHIQRIS